MATRRRALKHSRSRGTGKPWHDTQLPNEPVINAAYTGTYLLARGDLGRSASCRIIPVLNAGLGTDFRTSETERERAEFGTLSLSWYF